MGDQTNSACTDCYSQQQTCRNLNSITSHDSHDYHRYSLQIAALVNRERGCGHLLLLLFTSMLILSSYSFQVVSDPELLRI